MRLESTCKPRKGLGLFASLFASQLSFQLSTLSSLGFSSKILSLPPGIYPKMPTPLAFPGQILPLEFIPKYLGWKYICVLRLGISRQNTIPLELNPKSPPPLPSWNFQGSEPPPTVELPRSVNRAYEYKMH